jgi:hypothetical protein
MKTSCVRLIVGAVISIVSFGAVPSADAQTFTLSITTTGSNPGVVSIIPLGQLCGPFGGGTCEITGIPSGTQLKIVANSPSTPGVFASSGGSAAGCTAGSSTCTFVITENSSATLAFNAGSYPSVTINLTGAPGKVGVGNSQCQNVDGGFSACTTYWGTGSEVTLQAGAPDSTAFAGFLNGTGNATGCTTSPCTFTLTGSSSIDAKFTPCKVSPSMFGGTLHLNFDLGTVEPVRWNVYLSLHNTVRLLSIALPVVDPPVQYGLPVPGIPPIGSIGVLTTMVDASDGITCSSWRTVDTGTTTPDAVN